MITPSVHFFGKAGDRWFSLCPISVSQHLWQSQLKCKMNWYIALWSYPYFLWQYINSNFSKKMYYKQNWLITSWIYFLYTLSLSLNLTHMHIHVHVLWAIGLFVQKLHYKAMAKLVTTLIYLQIIPMCICIYMYILKTIPFMVT